MFLVIGLNSDEFGRGIDRPVHRFDDEDALRKYLLSCGEDISRLEIYQATKMEAKLEITQKKEERYSRWD